jgi:hypothetical protein
VPIELSDNCYLIHHPRRGWFLWDTGLPDALAATPEGTTSANGALHVKRPKTLAGQLDELGVKPADIKAMAISHTHPDYQRPTTAHATLNRNQWGHRPGPSARSRLNAALIRARWVKA